MKIHHLNCGTLCPLGARLLHGHGPWFGRGHLVCHCLLIESNDGLILVDTGLGTEDLHDPVRRLGRDFVTLVGLKIDFESTAIAQIEKLGFKSHDVRHIFPTHLDVDHMGGMPDFPKATIHLSMAEYQAAMHPKTANERNRYRKKHWCSQTRWQLYDEYGENWFSFQGVRAPIPGLDLYLVPLPGHTRGHTGIAVRTERGWLFHAGDAYYHHHEVYQPYGCPIGLRLFQSFIAVSNKQRVANLARLRDLALDHSEIEIFSAHSPQELIDQAAALSASA